MDANGNILIPWILCIGDPGVGGPSATAAPKWDPILLISHAFSSKSAHVRGSRGLKVQFKLRLSLAVYIAMYICMHSDILIPWI